MAENKQTTRQLIFEILRFLIVGGTATLVDYFSSYLFYHIILPPTLIGEVISLILSTALGFCIGLLVNWFLSVAFVYKQVTDKKKSSSFKSFLIFTVIGLIGLGLTEIGMYIGVRLLSNVSILGIDSFLGEGLNWWISKVVMTAIVLVWNYVGRKVLIFK